MKLNRIDPEWENANPNYHPYKLVDDQFLALVNQHEDDWGYVTEFKDFQIRRIHIGNYVVAVDPPDELGNCTISLWHREKVTVKRFAANVGNFTEVLSKTCDMAVQDAFRDEVRHVPYLFEAKF